MNHKDKWEIRYYREKTAREEAEQLLEKKSLALYKKTLDLDNLILQQQEIISSRTREIEDAYNLLKIENNRFESLVLDVPGVIFQQQVDKDHNVAFSYVSPRAKKLLNIDPQALIDSTAQLMVHQEDHRAFDLSLRKSIPYLKSWYFEGRFKIGNTYKWLRWMSRPQSINGSIQAFGLVIDITSEAESARHMTMLSDAISHTNNGVIITNKENKVIWANEAIFNISGYHPDEFLGQSPGSVLQGKQTSAKTRKYIRNCIQKTNPFSAEILNYKKDKSHYWIRIQATPLFDHSGKFKYYIAIQSDITEERKTKEKLALEIKRANALASEAKMANLVKNKFLSSMSHELRTPLNGIIGFAQILKDNPTFVHKEREQIETIHRSGEHLLILINDLLDIATVDSEKRELLNSHFDLDHLLNQSIEMASALAQRKNIKITQNFHSDNSIPPGSKITLFTDPKTLRQILENAIICSIKKTKAVSICLSTFIQNNSDGNANLRFTIAPSDHPPTPPLSLPQEDSLKINPLTDSSSNLEIIRKLTSIMNGSFQCEEDHCSVQFTLPFSTSLNTSKPSNAPPFLITGYQGKRHSILIVDDIVENRQLLADLLLPLGFHVHEATNGYDALNELKNNPYDIVLTDIIMPFMNGHDLAKSIRNDPAINNLVVIAVSASLTDKIIIDKDQQSPFNGFLPKPINAIELRNLIADKLHLQWTKSPQPTKTPSPSTPSIQQPDSFWNDLRAEINRGDIQAIQELIPRIELINPALYDQLKSLALSFQINEIEQIVLKNR